MSFSEIGQAAGGLGAGIAVLAGAGGRSGTREYKKAISILEQLKSDPGFDMSSIPPADLKVFSEFFPEIYQAVVPESVQLAQEGPEGRQAQMKSLATLQDMQDQSGLGLQDKLAAQQAGRTMQGELASSNDQATRDLAQRGRLGGGDAMMARMAGNQNAVDLANQLGSQIAQSAMQRRFQAAGAAGSLGGQVRQGDVDLSSWNADAANRFNEMRSGRQNEAAQYAAAVRNQAGAQRSATQQRIGETNALAGTEAARRNQEYGNLTKQQIADNAYRKAMGISGANQALGSQRNLEKAMKDQQIMGLGKSAGSLAGGIMDYGSSMGMGGGQGGTGGAGGAAGSLGSLSSLSSLGLLAGFL